MLEGLYTGGLHALNLVLPLLARGEGKLARGIRGRRGVVERAEEWARENRAAGVPLVWFHAPSVGEGFQARAVMDALRRRRPEMQIVYTYFSPSAEPFARSTPADFSDYLPLDLPATMRRMLDALQPAAVVFSKTEIWPNLVRETARRGVPTALLSATLPPASSRLSIPARALLGPAYRRLDAVAAISPADAERYALLGVPAERRSVMGDSRFDQVAGRAAAVEPTSPLLDSLRAPDRTTLVAGSTWQADEERLVEVWAALGAPRRERRLILAPHEPTREHLSGLEALLDRHGLTHQRLAEVEKGSGAATPDAVLVDRVGVLGHLYALAGVAYVGGGWGTVGLHSVLEPAAFGAPVIFGPNHSNAREAAELVRAGGAFSAGSTAELRDVLERWVAGGAAERRNAGSAARAYVEAGLGAAERGADLVEGIIRGGAGP